MNRRELLKAAALAAVTPTALSASDSSPTMIGVQISPYSLFDEGIERCLDRLRDEAAVNTLFIYSQCYHSGYSTPPNVMADDHGITVRDLSKRKLPRLWFRHNAEAFANRPVRHERVTDDFEYGDRDIFREIRSPASDRGMKVYARILEAGARRSRFIPGYESVLTVDHEGKRGHGPCWNNPHYREWVYTTIRELVTNYELDGLQYGAERTGPLSHVLYRGLTPTCFCEYCIAKNKRLGIDAERAQTGFTKLYQLMHRVSELAQRGENPRSVAGLEDGVLSSVMRTIYRYPEVLRWDYEWFQADEEICSEVHSIAKSIRPTIDSGRHVDHQRSSWDFFFRSAMSYDQMAKNADFIKPIVYHEPMGPRLRWWVLERMKNLMLSDLTLEQSLDLYYSVFAQDVGERPSVDELDAAGLGPEYVYRETQRCKQSVGGNAKVYAGIGIDVPWYIPGGMEKRPSDPNQLCEAVERSFEAGADGLLASREYEEMSMASLRVFGRAVRSRTDGAPKN